MVVVVMVVMVVVVAVVVRMAGLGLAACRIMLITCLRPMCGGCSWYG